MVAKSETVYTELEDDDNYYPSEVAPQAPKKRGRPKGSGSGTSTAKAFKQTVQVTQFAVIIASGLSALSIFLALRAQHPPLLMSDVEAGNIARPLARILTKTDLYKRYGHYVADSNDYFALGVALYQYGARVFAESQILAEKRRQERFNGTVDHSGVAETTTGNEQQEPTGASVAPHGRINLNPSRGE